MTIIHQYRSRIESTLERPTIESGEVSRKRRDRIHAVVQKYQDSVDGDGAVTYLNTLGYSVKKRC